MEVESRASARVCSPRHALHRQRTWRGTISSRTLRTDRGVLALASRRADRGERLHDAPAVAKRRGEAEAHEGQARIHISVPFSMVR